MHRRLAILMLALMAAVPAVARVLSYSPYTNKTTMVGFHDRSSRHFALVEALDNANAWSANQVVLYDAKGQKEPRVVYPADGVEKRTMAVALYEPRDTDAVDTPPMIVIVVEEIGGSRWYFSADGGTNWKEVAGLHGLWPASTIESDFGGPSVQGMTTPIHTGDDQRPFYISAEYHGIYAITSNGVAETVLAENSARIVGKDRAGRKFLARSGAKLEMLTRNGNAIARKRIADVQNPSVLNVNYTGWITADGSAYIQVHHYGTRYLYFWKNDRAEFIAAPYDQLPPGRFVDSWPGLPYGNLSRFFAVPTNDYEGAWLLQRDSTKPTTLSRHTPQQGLQHMWSDVSGPEVEALIAGESGQTLLIQVHRDRSVTMQRPFIDPALAVWRVGDPIPRQYDELYLAEEWNKGFIHVDVDRLTEGEPFVFNSGSITSDGEVITSPSVGGGGDVIQEWGVVRGSLRQHLVLPGVARLHGAFASRWLTDVTVYNPSESEQNVDVRFVGLGEDLLQASALRQKTITLRPREIRFMPDVLSTLFDIADGGGALHFRPASGVNVFGRTYSVLPTGGTFGFGMQAIDFYNAASPRFPVTFAGAFPGQNFRTNILITDTSGRGTEASLGAYGVTGPIGANAQTIAAPPGGILQYNGLGSAMHIFSRDAGGLVVQPTRGSAITTVVAIDNRTNDATYFPPDLPSNDQIRAIPVIGHLDGANGSHFRSDLYLFNPSQYVTTVTLEAKQWSSPSQQVKQFSLLPREARVISDALPTLFGMTGFARLRYWSDNQDEGVRVTSRTYTIDDKGATYGSLIPTLNPFQIATPGDHLEILGVTGGSGFRANLGIVDLSPSTQSGEASVRVYLFDQNMTQLDTFALTIPRAGGTQINDIFAARGITPPEAAMIYVQVADGGMIGAYATLTDNITNDTNYLGANLGAKEN